jgi:hypothetical protein
MKNRLIQAAGQPLALAQQAGVRIEAAADGTAKRPTFTIDAYNGGALRVSAFYRPVVVDLAGLRAAGPIPILLDHDASQIVGQGTATITPTSVKVAGTVTGDDEPARKVTSHAKNGFVWAASVGVGPERTEFVDAGLKVTVNGQEFTGPINIVRSGRLGEVSFVAVGADETASARVAATAAEENAMKTFAEWLQAMGLEVDKLTDEQKSKLQAKYDAEQKPAPKVEPKTEPKVEAKAETDIQAALVEERKVRAAEARRVAKIAEVCIKHPEIQAKAIEENWTSEKAELEVLRAARPKAPAGIVTDNTISEKVMLAASCQSLGLANIEKEFDAPTLEAAHKRYKGRIGLQQLLVEAAMANGYEGGAFSVRSDLRGVLQAAFSTHTATGVLSATANKFLMAAFSAVEDSWRQIAAIRPVSDFKTVTSYRLSGDLQYDELPADGQIKHGTLSDDSMTNAAKTYAKMLALTRKDIINDDLGALNQVPTMLGRGAALKFNKVFWTAFMNNAAFFTAARGNYQEGSGTPLAIASLTAAELLFLNQTDANSAPLGVAPEILLVPNALNVTATQLMRDTEVRDTTASTKYLTGNPHAGKFRVVRSSYLSNSTITGYSTTAWYLLTNPASLATIEACFLNGQQAPTVETADADFNTLGIQMRGYHDFGVALQDYRAGLKSKGAA